MTFLAYLHHWRHARVMTRCRAMADEIRRRLGLT